MSKNILEPAKTLRVSNQASLTDLQVTHEKELKKMSLIKRFYERWEADGDFRQQLLVSPDESISHYRLEVTSEEVRPIWDTEFAKKAGKEASILTLLEPFQKRFTEELNWAKTKHSLPSIKDPRFKAWRARQIARSAYQFHPSKYNAVAHALMCFELNKGCSVGCWFCGVSAPRLSDIFSYNKENAKLWCEVLELMKNLLGCAAHESFCYWATDPLDNPDYEKFCCDFHEILGEFPQTTTALALRDPARTRSLLKLADEKGCRLNRFSILSLKMVNQVHEEFSAEELTSVKLVFQNPESIFTKSKSGRARQRSNSKAEENHESLNNSTQGTIACVTGFLFNMIDRSVKLISPCNASDRWPLGYIVYDEGTFSDADGLKVLLERMISDNMPLSVRIGDRIAFRRDLEYESMSDGFKVFTKFKTFKFRHTSYIRELGEVICQGNKTGEEILAMFEARGVSSVQILNSLNLLFERGLLDDEPQPKDSENVS